MLELGLDAPLPTRAADTDLLVHGEMSAPPARWLVGEGSETERLRAAQSIVRMDGFQDLCANCDVPGEFRECFVQQMRTWGTMESWVCATCDSENEDLLAFACSMCKCMRVEVGPIT